MTRNQQIIAMRGKKSYGVIAQELGVTRNVVAGVCFRADHDRCDMMPSPGQRSKNKIGTGFRTGSSAPQRLPVRNRFTDENGRPRRLARA